MKHFEHTIMGASFLDSKVISERVYSIVQSVDAAMASVKSVVRVWARRSQDRRYLASLNQHMLRDIGLEPHEIQAEISKPFWKK